MRLLAVADLHYSLPQFDWVLEVAPDFDVVVLAGDLLELSSIVDRRAQAIVVQEIFQPLARGDTARDLLRQSRSRCAERDRREDRQMARATPKRGRRLRRRVLPARRHSLHRLPVVGRTDHAGRNRRAACRGRADRAQAMDLDPSRAARQIADQLGWRALFRRHASLRNGSSSTSPTSCSQATCINRPSSRTAPGSTASGRPGCSMQGSNSARRRRISSSTLRPAKRFGSPPREISTSASASRSSGRCHGSKGSQTGSKPRIGLSLRAGREFFVLLVDQRFEHLSDHAEVIAAGLRTDA